MKLCKSLTRQLGSCGNFTFSWAIALCKFLSKGGNAISSQSTPSRKFCWILLVAPRCQTPAHLDDGPYFCSMWSQFVPSSLPHQISSPWGEGLFLYYQCLSQVSNEIYFFSKILMSGGQRWSCSYLLLFEVRFSCIPQRPQTSCLLCLGDITILFFHLYQSQGLVFLGKWMV